MGAGVMGPGSMGLNNLGTSALPETPMGTGAMPTNTLPTNATTANTLSTNPMSTNQMATNQMATNQMSTTQMSTNQMSTNTMNPNNPYFPSYSYQNNLSAYGMYPYTAAAAATNPYGYNSFGQYNYSSGYGQKPVTSAANSQSSALNFFGKSSGYNAVSANPFSASNSGNSGLSHGLGAIGTPATSNDFYQKTGTMSTNATESFEHRVNPMVLNERKQLYFF